MIAVVLVIMYGYTIIGMEFLHNALDRHASPSIHNCSPYCPSFQTSPTTFMLLFQLVMGSTFVEALKASIEAAGYGAAVYYCSFLLICHVMMLSLIAALVFQVGLRI